MRMKTEYLLLGAVGLYLFRDKIGSVFASFTQPIKKEANGASGVATGPLGTPIIAATGKQLPVLYSPDVNALGNAASLDAFITLNQSQLTQRQVSELRDYQGQLARGASLPAIQQMAAQTVANPQAVVRPGAVTAPAGTSVGSNLISTGTGYYNPFTGASYVPKRY